MTAPGAGRPGLSGVFARGLAMGVAEIVPGVSGGTIAFVTGIYERLLGALGSFANISPRTALDGGWPGLARRHDLLFLIALGAGMVVSFVLMARVIGALIETRPAAVYGFFAGLIAGAVPHVGAGAARAAAGAWRIAGPLGVLGLAAGLALAWLQADPAAGTQAGGALLFASGVLAACAWMLPGVSGAFVLLVLGLYAPLVAAVNGADLARLAVFAAGLGLGVVAFSKLLGWALGRFRAPLLALLTGLMAGSLLLLWRRTGIAAWSDAQLPWALGAAAVGAAAMAALSWLARSPTVASGGAAR